MTRYFLRESQPFALEFPRLFIIFENSVISDT